MTAIERIVTVADETARFALTTATVQNGDAVIATVGQTSGAYLIRLDGGLYSNYFKIVTATADNHIDVAQVSVVVFGN